MPDPQIKVTVLDRWPIIVEFMGGPLDGGAQTYPEVPPLALLFPCDRSPLTSFQPRWPVPTDCLQREARAFPRREYDRYEIGSRQTGSRLRYHYMGKDRVEVHPSSDNQPHAARG